uniref:serine hydrolase domain-containing protein n=1 Tax=Flavobacterium sp. TaxID=239 RepID=UPI00404A591D
MKIAVLVTSLVLMSTVVISQNTNFQKINSLLLKFEKTDAPGLSIGIAQNGRLVYSKAIGFANLEYDIKNTNATVFSLASIAKQFTSACIWTLVRDKKLDLEEDIRTYLPEMPVYNYPIKIKNLLNHSSGLSNYHTLMYLKGFDYDLEYYDNQAVLALATKQKKLNHIPGQKIVYANTNYTLLTIIIERISQKNLHVYAKEQLFEPLEMNATLIKTENNSIIKNSAVGYQNSENGYLQNPRIQKSYGAGSMGSTVLDMVKWMTVLNGKNENFKPLTDFLITCENLNNGEKANYARGVMIDTYKNLTTISHSGSGWGEQSQLITIPEKDLGIIIFANTNTISPTLLSYQIIDILLPNSISNTKKAVNFKPKNKDYQQFIGSFKEINSDMKMEILLENDTLKAKGSQAKKAISLKEIEKNIFVRLNNESVKYDFSRIVDNQLSISFGGTPFHFEKAHFVNPKDVNLNEFVGDFYSEELDISYHFFIREKQLFLSYKNHENIALSTVQKDEFGNNDRTLYHFVRNESNAIIKMFLSCDGTVKEIEFVRN